MSEATIFDVARTCLRVLAYKALYARAMAIPAVVGCGEPLTEYGYGEAIGIRACAFAKGHKGPHGW